MSESDLEEEWKSLRAEWPDLRRETWLSMRDGAGVVDLRRLLGFPPEVIYVDRGDAEALFEQGTDPGWERFRERWPSASGLATVSLVGFSPAGDQALLYVEFQSGSDAGYGWYHFRKESEDGRTIDDTWMVWVS